jgi:sodium/potassium-transporting ATPase subunit alpha
MKTADLDIESNSVTKPQSFIEVKTFKTDAENNKFSGGITEHSIPLQDLENVLKTNFMNGLTSEMAEERFNAYGPNSLTPPKKKSMWLKLLLHLAGGFSLLLWAGSLLCFIVYAIDSSVENLILGIVLAGVVSITGIFSFYQELKSEAVLAGFLNLTPTTCEVLRDGKFRYVIININIMSRYF